MRSHYRRLLFFCLILLLAAGAAWIVLPQGSRVNLHKLKIPFSQTYSTHLGLDLQGGSHLVYQANFKDVQPADRQAALAAARDICRAPAANSKIKQKKSNRR